MHLNDLIYYLEVLIAFEAMIFIHEGGHYLACKFYKVDVEEFALGFGNLLWSRKWKGTLFSIRAFPLGGFCKPKGGDLSGQSVEEIYAKPAEPGDFLFASWWKRVVIFLAGPGMNFVSGFLILVAVLMIGEKVYFERPVLGFVPPESLAYDCGFKKGDLLLKVDGKPIQDLSGDLDGTYAKLVKDPSASALFTVERGSKTLQIPLKGDVHPKKFGFGLYSSAPAVIGDVPLGTPAWKAGIRPGDKILSVDGRKVSDWLELSYVIKSGTNDHLELQVDRNGKDYPVSITRIYNGDDHVIGIQPQPSDKFTVTRMSFFQAVPEAGLRTYYFCKKYLEVIWKLVTLKMNLKDNVGGAVTIFRTLYQKAAQGIEEFLKTVISISFILGLMNLLPLGIVDGGQIILCLFEAVKRKPLSIKFQNVYQIAGFTLVGCLMLYAVGMDVWNWVMENVHRQIP
ncbi:MAG TPA: RIP metalloprotease RseP [bacterium]|nr:RIP metalloprotease RseP [bacterium]